MKLQSQESTDQLESDDDDRNRQLEREESNRKSLEIRGSAALGGLRAYQSYTFERFNETKHNAEAINAGKEFNPKQHNLMFIGQVGTGKTHLAVATARKFIPNVGTLKQANLSREVRGCQDANREDEIIKYWASIPVLILDDLGAAKDTEFMVSLLYEVIDWRYMNRPGGLIVTSNRTLDQLAEKLGDDRVPSRLAQMCKVFNLAGEQDHRLEKK